MVLFIEVNGNRICMSWIFRVVCLLFFSFGLAGVVSTSAQDRHFSQFYASPLTMNPALTGAFNGKFRLAGIYRDQWRPSLERPFTTLSTAADFRFLVPQTSQVRDAFGVGLVFFKDEVKNFDLTNNEINIAVAYHKSLNAKNTKILSLGFQGGIAQRNINYNNLSFEDMFNQENGYTLATGEAFPQNNLTFGDIAAGLNYSWAYKRDALFQIGAAMHHIAEPNISFFPGERGGESVLLRRYQIHTSMILPMQGRAFFSPRLHLLSQGTHQEMIAGTNFRFLTNDYSGLGMHIGTWVRAVADVDQPVALESATLFYGLEWHGMLLGMSYDMGISNISQLGYKRGAFEISFAFMGEYEDAVIQCPSF